VLGYLLWRNYRKEKKEMMEHDPDFDENGDVTALPDFPPTVPITRDSENPFHNRNSIAPNRLTTLQNNSGISLTNVNSDPYIVLPYTHQSGSKASLEEYSRQLGDNLGYQRGSSYMSRTTSMIHDPNISPQKSSLRYEQPTSPTKQHNGKKYTNIPTFSQTSLGDSNGSCDTNEKDDNEKYPAPNVTEDHSNSDEHSSHHQKELPTLTVNDTDVDNGEFTFGDETNDNIVQEKTEVHQTNDTFDDSDLKRDMDPIANSLFAHGDDSQMTNQTNDMTQDHDEADGNSLVPSEKPKVSKSPRISQFDLLNNDSDEEEHALTKEQEEQIQRMKSVYKVYFDKEKGERNFSHDSSQPIPKIDIEEVSRINKNLTADTDYSKRMTTTSSIYTRDNFANNDQGYYDANQPPYPEQGEHYASNYQGQYYDPNQGYYDQNGQYYPPQPYDNQHQEVPPAALPPLKTLGSASDIGKSTAQTYTDFQPRIKGGQASSGKVPFVPIENEGVWSSPVNSPVMEFDGQFNQPTQTQPTVGGVPSASQVARTSVVMLNPVTEIIKNRKFKPAGSLPTFQANLHPNMPANNSHYHEEFDHAENDLIPGNRKSAVRRMMNTNF
jgi:hypothetical protein